MSTIYEEQKDEDGFLYVQYSGESTFGEFASLLPWNQHEVLIDNQ